eukprot:scaffold89722_cov19-Tisochrysis_lutea.AAC.1
MEKVLQSIAMPCAFVRASPESPPHNNSWKPSPGSNCHCSGGHQGWSGLILPDSSEPQPHTFKAVYCTQHIVSYLTVTHGATHNTHKLTQKQAHRHIPEQSGRQTGEAPCPAHPRSCLGKLPPSAPPCLPPCPPVQHS